MTDIRQDPEVLRVTEEMGLEVLRCGQWTPCPKCEQTKMSKCGRKFITLAIGDLAFWMRGRCDSTLWMDALVEVVTESEMRGGIDGKANLAIVLKFATPAQWIEAACKAWKGMK